MKKQLIFITAIALFTINAALSAFDLKNDTPQAHGVDEAAIQKLQRQWRTTQITSSIIVKDGAVIARYFADGYDEKSVFPVHSCSKSITSAIVGAAIEQGFIADLDVRVSVYFPEETKSGKPFLKDITLKQLLMNTSGLKSTDSEIWGTWRASDNWIAYIFQYPLQHTPGKVFDYSTGNTHIVSAIVQKATGQTLYAFGKQQIFDKIGLDSIVCDSDPQGISDGGNGFRLSALDMAKFGQLYLQNGQWDGQQIISADWIKESTRIQTVGLARYGYQWWLRKFGKHEYTGFFAHGWGEQVIAVVPEVNMVITFTSNCPDNRLNATYWRYIGDIVDAVRGDGQ